MHMWTIIWYPHMNGIIPYLFSTSFYMYIVHGTQKDLFLEIIKGIAVLISGDDGSPGASISSATDHQSQVIRSQTEQTRIPHKTQSSIDNLHSGNNRSQHIEERIQRIPRKTDHDQTRLPRVS